MVFGGGRRPRCCCARRRRSRRRAARSGGVLAPTSRARACERAKAKLLPLFSAHPGPSDQFCGRDRLLAAQQRRLPCGGPITRSRLLDAPEQGSSHRRNVLPRVPYHEARNVDAARHATRGCWGGAAPTAAWPRSAARRSGGASGPSVPAGRRPRLGLPAAAGAPAPRPGLQRKSAGRAPTGTARGCSHTNFFRRGG